MRFGRKLEHIRQELALLAEEGKVKGFFNNVDNADRLGGLVEDIRDVMMDYQVCVSISLTISLVYNLARHRCSKICTTGTSYSS